MQGTGPYMSYPLWYALTSSSPNLLEFVQGRSQNPDNGPGSLFLKQVGSASCCLEFSTAPSPGGVKVCGMMGHKPSRY